MPLVRPFDTYQAGEILITVDVYMDWDAEYRQLGSGAHGPSVPTHLTPAGTWTYMILGRLVGGEGDQLMHVWHSRGRWGGALQFPNACDTMPLSEAHGKVCGVLSGSLDLTDPWSVHSVLKQFVKTYPDLIDALHEQEIRDMT